MTQLQTRPVAVSVLIPAKDEAENLPELARLCGEALGPAGFGFEVIVVDDGSTDATPAVLAELEGKYPWLRHVTHRQRRGIADALRSGADAARGDVLVFYPGDLQYLPEDIPRLVAPILEGRADIVTGTKQGKYEKAFVSTVYNTLCRWLFGVRVTDLNSVKAYRREIMDVQPLRPDWHRYMVVIAAAEGYTLTSTPVPLYPRKAGVSKFGWGRIPIGVLDLLSVWFQLRFGRKPMLFFGVAGALLFFLGFLTGVVALVMRYGYGFGFRPLLDLIMVLVICGVALFGFGFVGELVAQQREEIRELARRRNGG
ncbi:MAG TPA: DPM/DPG synthase family glycosyltransferase [Gemmatimonadales bacterium]|nr:DPM/DPG synthase family glycosyltransferase [Gemmatimonadales bacterium]